jgi:vacuolar protein sorting-associated protein 41
VSHSFIESDLTGANSTKEKQTLVGFVCGHVFHLSCIISTIEDPAIKATAEKLQAQLAADADDQSDNRSVGAKVAHAHIIKNIVGKGCPLCHLIVDD